MGAANISPNSPIQIKKHVRAPGNRKLLKSFKKMPGNTVKMVNEYRTSRMCARCFTPFPLNTLSHRFKKCDWCVPNEDRWPDGLQLPTKILSIKSKRMRQAERRVVRRELIANPNRDVGFGPKVICYRKNWQQNVQQYDADDDLPTDHEPNERILKTVWHRDITAAKLIMYRGKLFLKS